VTTVRIAGAGVAYDGHEVLHGLSLDVAAGGWVGVIGPNGAGKTTLLRAVAGLVDSSGDIRFDDTPVAAIGRRRLAQLVALVPQRPVIPEAMSVTDYVLMGRTPYIPYLGRESGRDVAIVHDVLRRLELVALAERELGTLSGGELQRAVLGRALVQEAPVLLLDEPTAALDVGHQQQALELVDEIRRERGLAVLAAMHDLTLAGQFAEELVLLAGGRAVASGTPQAVLTEDAISLHFGASVKVVQNGTGVLVIPVRGNRHG
jgi:iron complex transport system ATP-binding protein